MTTTYDIYTSNNNHEATGHGADYVCVGINPADAVAKFIGANGSSLEGVTEVTAFDDEMSASAYPLPSGEWELHVYIGESDTAITIPPVDYVSISEAAERLSLTRQRVHVLLKNGQLTGRMVGNACIVARASVLERMK